MSGSGEPPSSRRSPPSVWCRLLERHFPNLVDYAFTAEMENDLDRIATGEEETVPWLTAFYFGSDGLKERVATRLDEIDPRAIGSIPIGEDGAGQAVIARIGRYGPYVERGEERASIPEDVAPDELTVARALELLETQNAGDKIFGTDPDTGLTVYGRTGRFGPYVQLGEVEEGSKEKPKRASLLKTMSLDELSLDDALRLLSLPRMVGTDDARRRDRGPQRAVRPIHPASRGSPKSRSRGATLHSHRGRGAQAACRATATAGPAQLPDL